MKNHKLFKKMALLLAVLALAVVLVIGTIAIAAAEEESAPDYQVVHYATQASIAGNVELKFYYSSLGSAKKMVVVVDGYPERTYVTELMELQNIVVDEETKETRDLYCVVVPLTAAEMTKEVSVYPADENGENRGEPMTMSVQNYINQALGKEKYAKYFDQLRALANWGAMAQKHFLKAEDADLANVGIFARGTNPVGAVVAAGINAPEVSAVEVAKPFVEGSVSVNADLSEGKVALEFFTNSEEPVTVASIYRGEELLTDSEAVTDQGDGRYSVRIGNINPNYYDDVYTVEMRAGENTLTIEYSLLNYFQYIVTPGSKNIKGEEFSATEKDVVRSMFQFYQTATGEVNAECEHTVASGVYWASAGATSAYAKCPLCFADLGHQAIDNSVNTYIPAGVITHSGKTGGMDITLKEDGDGTKFVRIDNTLANVDGWFGINPNYVTFNGVTGNYLVMKVRLGANGLGQNILEIYANTTGGLTGDARTAVAVTEDNQWHTIVIDLASRVKKPSSQWVAGEAGYTMKYFQIRPFTGFQAQSIALDKDTDPNATYIYVYSYEYENGVDAEGNPKTATHQLQYSSRLENGATYKSPINGLTYTVGAEENPFTLTEIWKQVSQADDYMDIAYMAICENLDEAKTLIDEANFEMSYFESESAVINTSTGACTTHSYITETINNEDGSKTYVASCAACSAVGATQNVPADINYFAPLGGMNYFNNGTTLKMNVVEDGVVFNRFTSKGGSHFCITGGGGAGSMTTSTYPIGKYMTFKYRVSNTTSSFTIRASVGNVTQSYICGTEATSKQVAANAPSEWRVAIVDLSNDATWTMGADGKIYIMFYPNGAMTMDIAYVAIVDSVDEAKLLMGEEDIYYVNYGTDFSGKGVTKAKSPSVCEHPDGIYNYISTENGYYIGCKYCETDTGINYISFSGGVWSPGTRGSITKETDSAGFTYNHYASIGAEGLTHMDLLTTNSAKGNGTFTAEGFYAGKYVAIKYRLDSDSAIDISKTGFIPATMNHTSNNCETILPEYIANKKNPLTTVGSLPATDGWEIAVFDITGWYGYSADSLVKAVMHTQNVPLGDTLDVAYVAYVDSMAELEKLAAEQGDTTYVVHGAKATAAPHELSFADHRCTGECVYAVVTDANDKIVRKCSFCGKVAYEYDLVGSSANKFITPSNIAGWGTINGSTGTSGERLIQTDSDGLEYVRITNFTTGSWGQWSTGFAGGDGSYTVTGEYMVMKIRVGANGLNQKYLQMYIPSVYSLSSSNPNKVTDYGSASVSVAVSEDNQWHTIVVNLADRVAAGGFQANTDGTYSVQSIQLRPFSGYQTVAQSDDYMDIAYIAFCDDIEDVSNLVAEETYEWSRSTTVSQIRDVNTLECAIHYPATEQVSGTVHSIVCLGCDQTVRTYDTADLNYITTLANMDYYAANGGSLTKNLYDPAEKVFYNSYVGIQSTHWNFISGGGAGSYTGSAYNSGSYIIMKVRATGETKTTLELYASTDKTTNTGAGSVGSFALTPEEGWTVLILENPVNSKGKYALGTEANLYFMGMPGDDRKLDIAYLAVANTLSDAKTLLQDGETYKLYEGTFSKQIGYLNPDGSCAEHLYEIKAVGGTCKKVCMSCGHDGGVVEHTYSAAPSATTVDGNTTYTYTCTVCTSTNSKVVPASVTAYITPYEMRQVKADVSKNDLTASTHFNMANKVYAGLEDPYFGFNGGGASHQTGIFIWNRNEPDCGKSQASSYEIYTIDIGKAEYFVFKVRVTAEDTTSPSIGYSTTGAVGSVSVKIPYTVVGNGEWATYVVDLSEVASTVHKADESGNYIMDAFWMNITSFEKTDSMDIAYFAFVEDGWDNVAALVEDETVIKITNKSGTYEVVDTATGNVVE